MKAFLLGFIIGLILIPTCTYLYFRFGYAPVATAASPMIFERRLAGMALKARIEKEAPKNAPLLVTNENLMAGARLYRNYCAGCHGLPSQSDNPIANGMFPKPPQLFKGHGVTDDPPGETYWKVTNGIRMTGMPAYSAALKDNERWQISLMLANADKLSPDVRALLSQPLEMH